MNLFAQAVCAVIAAAALTGATAAPPVKPSATTGPLLVVDATGKAVGRWATDAVIMNVNSTSVALRTEPSVFGEYRFRKFSPGEVFFMATNCTGAPYARASINMGMASGSVVATPSGSMLYLLTGPIAPMSFYSVYSESNCYSSQDGNPMGTERMQLTQQPIPMSTFGITEPLRVE